MKKYLVFILLVLIAFSILFYFAQKNFNTPIQNNENSEEKWNVIAENNTFEVIRQENKTIVKNKESGIKYTPNANSCEKNIPNNLINSTEFYNTSVGIINLGPYKRLIPVKNTSDTFYQQVQNAGCSFTEGTIKLVPNDNTKIIECEIYVEYKLSTCQ